MIDICLPTFLKKTSQHFIFQEPNEINVPEKELFTCVRKDLLEIKWKLKDINKDFNEKVAEDRLKKINRLEKDIESHRLKTDKLQTYSNELNSKIESLEKEVSSLKEIQLSKSEQMKFLLHKYKSLLDIHLVIVPQSCDVYSIQVSYFTTIRLDNPKYYIKLLYNKTFKSWQLIEMQPQPTNFKKICEHLMLFQDIQGCFEAVRRIFLKYKK